MTTQRTGLNRVAASLWLLAVASNLSCGRGGAPEPSPGATATTLPVVKTRGGIEMIQVTGGSFSMGGRRGKPDEQPVHIVTVAPFLIDKTEVAQADYEKLNLSNPSHFKGPNLPVEQVSWAQAAVYCNARSKADGLRPCYDEDTTACDFAADGYRLPTEAEWEYACRAGSAGDYAFGSDPSKLTTYAWYADNSAKKTHPVGQKRPNAWGLLDMHGNVAEWCNDIYGAAYYQGSPASNPRGPTEGDQYVLRGGSWNSRLEAATASYRLGENPGFSDACLARDAIGFRCVRKLPATPTAAH